MNRFIHCIAPLLAVAFAAPWSFGLIKVQTPVSKMYSGSSSVVLGKVSKVNAETGVIEAAATTLKGDGVGEAIKVKVDNLPEVVKGVKEGSPLVLLIGRRSASSAMSLGDAWVFPEQAPSSKSNLFAAGAGSEAVVPGEHGGACAGGGRDQGGEADDAG